MRIVLIISLGVFSHLVIGRWMTSPWLVPDLTLVGIIVTMVRLPGYPLSAALYGGFLVMLLTVHHSVVIGLAYVGAGALTKMLATQWDLTDPFLQQVTVGIAETGLLTVALFLNDSVSLGLLGLSGVKVLITVACVPLVRRLPQLAK